MATETNRIIVPLDVDSREEALRIVDSLRGRVGMFKIGLQLFCAAGPGVVGAVVDRGECVFLDLKFHDIPNTVAGAVTEAARLGASLIDVHLGGGRDMVAAAVRALASATSPPDPRPRLLGVTVLTSLDEADLGQVGTSGSVQDHVLRLATLGYEAGVDGVVASPHEIAVIRDMAHGKGAGSFLIVTPGIRPEGSIQDDQKRVMTPKEAIDAGADYLVIGRPILGAKDRPRAVERILDEISR